MAIRALSEAEIGAELQKASLWRREGSEIVRVFAFSGFRDALRFVNAVAEQAEQVNHHPDILVQYSRVTLRLSTHDANGLSSRDFAFAQAADGLYSRC